MSNESVREEEEAESEEKRGVEEESLTDELCVFDSISTSFEECENGQWKKEIKDDIEKSEGATEEKQCFFKEHDRLKENLSTKTFEGSKEEEMSESIKERPRKSTFVFGSPMNSLSSSEISLLTKLTHLLLWIFLACRILELKTWKMKGALVTTSTK